MKFIDQMQREITMDHTPKRIISIVPSQTELLADLGLENEVIGITKFCIYPMDWFRTKERVGGTKTISIEKIKSLKPDLVIGNKEENDKKQVEALMQTEKVWMSDIKTLGDACDMIRRVGELAQKEERAEELAHQIEQRFSLFRKKIENFPKRRVVYFIWKSPFMVAGGETFIDHMLGICGLDNIFAKKGRYPEITLEELAQQNPEVIFLSSEPYPFREKHLAELQQAFPKAKVRLVDGELFSWYGTRLLKSPDYFYELLASLS